MHNLQSIMCTHINNHTLTHSSSEKQTDTQQSSHTHTHIHTNTRTLSLSLILSRTETSTIHVCLPAFKPSVVIVLNPHQSFLRPPKPPTTVDLQMILPGFTVAILVYPWPGLHSPNGNEMLQHRDGICYVTSCRSYSQPKLWKLVHRGVERAK